MKKYLHRDFDETYTMLEAGVSPYLVGPSGCGKTTLAKQIAEKKGLPFYYTGAVESAFQLRGFKDAHGNTVHTPFRDAYENGGIFLFDELDASNAQAVVSLHAALDNGVLDAPDGMIEIHKNFRYIGAANTWGHGATLNYMGRNPLDGATLDRYAFIAMDYDEEMERRVVAELYGNGSEQKWVLTVQEARHAVRELELRHIVSIRASFDGAALIHAKMPQEKVFKSTVLKNCPPDDVAKLLEKMENGVSMPVSTPARAEVENKIDGILKNLHGWIDDAEKLLNDSASGVKERLNKLVENIESKTLQLEQIQGVASKTPGLIDGEITDKFNAVVQRFNDVTDKLDKSRQEFGAAEERIKEKTEALKALEVA